MKTILIFFMAFICVTIAQEDEVKEDGALINVVDGVRIVGRVARMLSALSGAFEILIYVIIKNFIDVDVPNQIFNLLQIALYFSTDFL